MYSNAGVNGKCQLHFDKTIKWTAHLISKEQKISTFGSSNILRVEVVAGHQFPVLEVAKTNLDGSNAVCG